MCAVEVEVTLNSFRHGVYDIEDRNGKPSASRLSARTFEVAATFLLLLLLLLFILLQMVFTQWQWCYNNTQHFMCSTGIWWCNTSLKIYITFPGVVFLRILT
jgi:hypothetical protein